MLCHELDIEVWRELQRTDVNIEYLDPLLEFRKVDMNLSVETSGPHQRLVQNVSPVGGGKNDDTRIGVEAIHLRKQLVESVFPFVI